MESEADDERFDLEQALRATRVRLDEFGSEEGWERVSEVVLERYGRRAWEGMFGRKPLLPDHETAGFVERNCSLVRYVSGVDSRQLSMLWGEGAVDIVHEKSGGLFHHPDPRAAVVGVRQALREGGKLKTTETWMMISPDMVSRRNWEWFQRSHRGTSGGWGIIEHI